MRQLTKSSKNPLSRKKTEIFFDESAKNGIKCEKIQYFYPIFSGNGIMGTKSLDMWSDGHINERNASRFYSSFFGVRRIFSIENIRFCVLFSMYAEFIGHVPVS